MTDQGKPKLSPAHVILGVLLIGIVVLIFLPIACPRGHHDTYERLARNTLRSLTIAIERYRDDFHALPPDNYPSTNGSEVLWYHLCQQHKVGDLKYGPYLEIPEDRLKWGSAPNVRRFISPLGGDYYYRLLKSAPDAKGAATPNRYLIIDPGKDGKIAGTIGTEADGSEYFKPEVVKNGHSVDDDNIYSNDL
jgi:hypothetical protein